MANTQTTANTFQKNIKAYNGNITDYALFLGGLNTGNKALAMYDPLKTGYARIFFVRMPAFMEDKFTSLTKDVRHMLEYGFTRIDGIGNVELQTEQLTGGYAGRSFEVGTMSQDQTTNITIGLYEFAGSPVRQFTELWISGIADPFTGIGHYHGSSKPYAQYNHTAEAIYVMTDPSGRSDGIEYACLLTNMMPKSVKKDHFNYQSGQHELVSVDIDFSCVKYESAQINTLAKALVAKQGILANSIGYTSDYTESDLTGDGTHYATRKTSTNWGTDNNYYTE